MAQVTEGWSEDQWGQPACGEWTGVDLAGHLVTVARWYHRWLDRAEAGDSAPPFPADVLGARTAEALAQLEPGTGPERVDTFTREAEAYAERLPATWLLPYGYPFGTVTAGLHAGVATVEWHIHAWDLARAAGADHRPADAQALALGAIRCVAAATGGWRGAALGALGPIAFRRDPWASLLTRSGRHP